MVAGLAWLQELYSAHPIPRDQGHTMGPRGLTPPTGLQIRAKTLNLEFVFFQHLSFWLNKMPKMAIFPEF